MNEQIEQQIRERAKGIMQEARRIYLAKGVSGKTIDMWERVEKQRAYADARKEIVGS